MNTELEVDYETSKQILKETIQSFIEKQEEIKMNDKELQTIFDSIKMKMDIASWTTTHPFDPFKEGSVQAIVESLQSREFDKPMAVSVAYRKLLYNMITYARNEVLDDVNQSMKVAIRLFKMQKKYLDEITIWSLKVMQKMDEETAILEGKEEKTNERIFSLSADNFEKQAKIDRIKFMQEQLERTIDNLKSINTEIRGIINPEILKPEIIPNPTPTTEEKDLGADINRVAEVVRETKFEPRPVGRPPSMDQSRTYGSLKK